MSFGQVFPDRLAACYATLITIGVDSIRDFGSAQFGSIKALLDDAQPKSQEEHRARATIQFLYRQNPSSFYKFLISNKLGCLVLWTEAKCIVRHLGLRGVVYIKWNNGAQSYDVLPHRKAAARQAAVETPHSAVDRIERTILRRITMPDYARQPDGTNAAEPPVFSLKVPGDQAPEVPVEQGDQAPEVPVEQGDQAPEVPVEQGDQAPEVPVEQGDQAPEVPVEQGPTWASRVAAKSD